MLTFVAENVDPTNNFSERMIRFAVILRKSRFHTISERGSETLSVLLTVFKTVFLRLGSPIALPFRRQNRYLTNAYSTTSFDALVCINARFKKLENLSGVAFYREMRQIGFVRSLCTLAKCSFTSDLRFFSKHCFSINTDIASKSPQKLLSISFYSENFLKKLKKINCKLFSYRHISKGDFKIHAKSIGGIKNSNGHRIE